MRQEADPHHDDDLPGNEGRLAPLFPFIRHCVEAGLVRLVHGGGRARRVNANMSSSLSANHFKRARSRTNQYTVRSELKNWKNRRTEPLGSQISGGWTIPFETARR
jgi:hypothetical protein